MIKKHRKYKEIFAFSILLQLIIDVIMVNLSFIFAYWVRFYLGVFPVTKSIPPFGPYAQALGLVTIIWVITFKSVGLYKLRDKFGLYEFPVILEGVSISIIIMMSVSFLYRGFEYSRLVIILAWFIGIILVSLSRAGISYFRSHLRKKGFGRRRILLIGDREIFTKKDKTASFEIVDSKNQIPPEELSQFIRGHKIEEVIMTEIPKSTEQILEIANQCEEEGVELKIFPQMIELMVGSVKVDDLLGLPVLHIKSIPLTGFNFKLKRTLDIIISFILLLILFIPMLIIAILIKLDSRGPIFYKQQRLGYQAKKFNFLKFRSMVKEADVQLQDLLVYSERKGPVFKLKKDPRVTRVGKILRRYSLDELPQLINVLRGDMSIVGPRPQVLWEADYYDNLAKRRLQAMPGITGLWQVSGRGDISYDEMIKLDLFYIENWSLWLDFEILLRTIPAVLSSKGAY